LEHNGWKVDWQVPCGSWAQNGGELMRAAVYRGNGRIEIEDVPIPKIGSDEVLVKVAVCGVCPTDIKKIQHDLLPPPRIFGHETAGTIVEVGARVRNLRVGERVALHHHVPCLKCHACRHRAFAQCSRYKRTGITAGFEPAGGGFAEYVRVLSFCLPGAVKIPSRNSFAEGAMLEPVNTVLKAIRMLNLLPRDQVLITGQGPIGLTFTRLLKLRRIKVIATDFIEERLKLALQFGATQAFRPDDSRLSDFQIDAAVIAVPSNDAVQQAQRLLRGGGQLMLFAHTRRGDELKVDLSTICVDEKQMLGSYSSDFLLQNEVAELVFSRKLDVRKLITQIFPLERAAEAVAMAAQPAAHGLKVMVSPEINE
jgi:L-iditol 2-dehydrogenase